MRRPRPELDSCPAKEKYDYIVYLNELRIMRNNHRKINYKLQITYFINKNSRDTHERTFEI